MKKLFHVCLVFALLALAVGCKRDIPNPTLTPPSGVSNFAVNNSTVVLSSSNDSTTVATFSWQAANYGVSIPVTYTLMIDQPSDTGGAAPWGNAIVTNIPTGKLTQSWLGTDFNHLLNLLGLPTGVASPIVARLKQDLIQSNGDSSTVPTIHADLPMTVTPYHVVLNYPKLYVAGDFQTPTAWLPISQPGLILASVLYNSAYEGYVNFPNSGNNFKLCSEPDWNGTNYGWGTSGTTMSPTGNNLWTAGPGYIRVNADTKKLTIQYTTTSWTVAGDFNSWSLTGNPMTFNPTTNQWVATGVNMTAGNQWKFVGDNGWNNCFGMDSKGNFVFGNGSIGNFKVTKTGTYTVTLDLSQGAGNYTYSVK